VKYSPAKCAVLTCGKLGYWHWPYSSDATYFRDKRWCDDHKFNGDRHVQTSEVFVAAWTSDNRSQKPRQKDEKPKIAIAQTGDVDTRAMSDTKGHVMNPAHRTRGSAGRKIAR
jgi:hypothetical protein